MFKMCVWVAVWVAGLFLLMLLKFSLVFDVEVVVLVGTVKMRILFCFVLYYKFNNASKSICGHIEDFKRVCRKSTTNYWTPLIIPYYHFKHKKLNKKKIKIHFKIVLMIGNDSAISTTHWMNVKLLKT